MIPDRAKVEGRLIADYGPLIAVAKMDATTKDGTNANLEGAIHDAIIASGGSVTDYLTVTDEDILTVGEAFPRFMLLARLYVLETVWGNWPHVNMKDGEESQDLSDLADRLQKKIEEIKAELADPDAIVNVVGITAEASDIGLIAAGTCPPYGIGLPRVWYHRSL